MKVRWMMAVVAAFILGIFIAFYLAQVEVRQTVIKTHEVLTNILPVQTFELPLLKIVPDKKPSEAALESARVAIQPIEEPRESLNLPLPKEHKSLNLSLPKEWERSGEWKIPIESKHPNFFKPKEAKKFSISSKLIWDESEEAQAMSIEKTIEGAEFELQFKLP